MARLNGGNAPPLNPHLDTIYSRNAIFPAIPTDVHLHACSARSGVRQDVRQSRPVQRGEDLPVSAGLHGPALPDRPVLSAVHARRQLYGARQMFVSAGLPGRALRGW